MAFASRVLISLALLLLLCVAHGAEAGEGERDTAKGNRNSEGENAVENERKNSDEGGDVDRRAAVVEGTKVTSEIREGDDRIQPDEIKELFDRFDEDSNGYLNRKEVFRYFVATTPPDSKMGQKYKQKDYFNLVRYREFCKSVDADPLLGLTLENIKKAYEKHYGYAHKDWVVTASMRSLKIPTKEKRHLKDAFAAFDEDNNGFINWPEMQKMVPVMTGEAYEALAEALNADISEGIDLHGITKAYTRRTSALRKAIKSWEKPAEDVVIIKEGSIAAYWILGVFFIVCLVAPITAWMCGVQKTVQGRKIIKKAAQELTQMVKAG